MKKFGVIGFPIKHSFSPGYFAQKFADLELDDCEYQAYEIEDLKKLKALVKAVCGEYLLSSESINNYYV